MMTEDAGLNRWPGDGACPTMQDPQGNGRLVNQRRIAKDGYSGDNGYDTD
jgi:hypothetical protein